MWFTGQVKKKNEGGFLYQVGLRFFFYSQVVMVTAGAGHLRTPSLARKASPGLGVIQEPRMGILRHINARKQRATEWSEAKPQNGHFPLSLPVMTHNVSL